MNVDEIKSTYSMLDILDRYGLPRPNRAGFIRCPFHPADREPSMKIYPKDFNCFGCGANGDIFTFVQMMDGYLSGRHSGSWEGPTNTLFGQI